MTKFWLQRLQGKLLVMSRKALAPLEREDPVITVSQFTTRRRRTSFEMMSVWSARQGVQGRDLKRTGPLLTSSRVT